MDDSAVLLRRLALVALFALLTIASSLCVDAAPSRRVDVHLYVADTSEGAPLAAWYHSIGITDVWLRYPKGAFPVDAGPDLQGIRTAAEIQAAGTLDGYRKNDIRYWFFERPVPDFLYRQSKRADDPEAGIWDSSPETDALWSGVCNKIKAIYSEARKAGHEGVVYDSESYYSYSVERPWVWGRHDDQYGKSGSYYKRGLQMGKAINSVWPKARMIVAYASGYEGELWWYQGLHDSGLDLYLGPEHTYGAGPYVCSPWLGNEWYQSWWQGLRTMKYAPGDTAEDYLSALRDCSTAFAKKRR